MKETHNYLFNQLWGIDDMKKFFLLILLISLFTFAAN